MKRRWFAVLLAAIALTAGSVLVVNRPQPPRAITFQCWTNIDGKRHAVFLLPSVTPKPPSRFMRRNYFWRSFYHVRIDFEIMKPNGGTREGYHQGITQESSTSRPLEIAHPVFPEESSIRIAKAESALVRSWDNVKLPFDLPTKRWTFTLPPAVEIPK